MNDKDADNEEERALGRAIAEVADAEAGIGTPARVEAALRAHLRSRAGAPALPGGAPRARPTRWAAAGVIALLAAGAAAVVVVVALRSGAPGSPGVPREERAAGRATGARAIEGGAQALRMPPGPGAEPAPRASGRPFQPLGSLAWAEASRSRLVVRVLVPAALSVQLGWPVVPGREDRLLPADVLVGEDGLARAIRFVSFRIDRP